MYQNIKETGNCTLIRSSTVLPDIPRMQIIRPRSGWYFDSISAEHQIILTVDRTCHLNILSSIFCSGKGLCVQTAPRFILWCGFRHIYIAGTTQYWYSGTKTLKGVSRVQLPFLCGKASVEKLSRTGIQRGAMLGADIRVGRKDRGKEEEKENR